MLSVKVSYCGFIGGGGCVPDYFLAGCRNFLESVTLPNKKQRLQEQTTIFPKNYRANPSGVISKIDWKPLS